MRFNEKLQQLRKANKLSQEQLADMLDVTRQSVSKWESGTTYPEMDKLITMCKIFKCSLDDLTNDEITEINRGSKDNNNGFIGNLVGGVLEIVEKTVKMLRSMNAKQIAGLVVTLFILGCFLCILRIPFESLEDSFSKIAINIPSNGVSAAFIGLFNMVFDIVFFILYVMVFVYIYKLAYLDRYDFVEKEKIVIEENGVANDGGCEETTKERIRVVRDGGAHDNSVFSFLGNLVIWFFRIFAGFCLMPFVVTVVALFAALIVILALMVDGVVYVGVFMGVVFAIILNLWLLEIGCVFVFNKRSSFKRLMWTFFIGLAGVGVSLGLTAMEISSTVYIDQVPSEFELSSFEKEFAMSEDIKLDWETYYFRREQYVVDEALSDKIVIKLEYYSDVVNPIVDLTGDSIEVNNYYARTFKTDKKVWDLIKEDLSKKEIRNYGDLNSIKMTIISSEKNLAKLKANSKKYYEEQHSYRYDYYDNVLEVKIENYESRIESLKEENEALKEKIEELEARVQGVLE